MCLYAYLLHANQTRLAAHVRARAEQQQDAGW
jgi:hypothetical protein